MTMFNPEDDESINQLKAHEDEEAHKAQLMDGVFTDLFDAVRTPPKWVIEDLLPTGLVFVGGPPKTSMKSTVVEAMALAVAEQGIFGLPSTMLKVTRPGRVLGFSYEADAGELRHTAEVGMSCLKPKNDKSILIADDPFLFRLDDDDGLSKMLHWCESLSPRMVFLDPLRDFHSIEEKDSGPMNRLLRPLQQWAKKADATFVVVHHTAKKKKEEGDYDAGDLRGTSALFGMADGALMISPRSEGVIHIVAKFKKGASWERTVQLAVWGAKGEEVITDVERLVLKLITSGADYASIAKQLKISKSRVVDAVAGLVRTGRLVKEGKKLKRGTNK